MDDVTRYLRLVRISDPAWRVHRVAAMGIRSAAEKYFSGRMLEIGCGTKQKALLIGDLVSEHVGLDHEGTQHDRTRVDIFGSAYDIPVEDESFDCVLSTAVLEHLEEPGRALKETLRILKPGGHVLFTAPMIWHLHEEPRDFYRYTQYGLEYLFTSAGFEIVRLEPLSGFFTTFFTEANYYLRRFRRGLATPVIDLAVLVNNGLAVFLDRGPLEDKGFAWMHLIIAKKPDVT